MSRMFGRIVSVLLVILIRNCIADVTFQPPKGNFVGGGSVTISWSAAGPEALDSFKSYELTLMAGGNTVSNQQSVAVAIPSGNFITGISEASLVVPASAGGLGDYAYFFQMTSVSSTGNKIINYSDRFTMTEMTGSWTSAVQAGIDSDATSFSGPPSSTGTLLQDPAAGTDTANQEFDVPYSLQTGLMRYASMQPVPGTKITATNTGMLYPTSGFTIATTYLGGPSITATMTAVQTFSVVSVENTLLAASQPIGMASDIKRFMERWVD